MTCYISIAVTFEIFFIMLAAFSEIRRYTNSLSDAYVYAVILILALLSVTIQFFFLFEIHKFYPIVDVSLLFIAVYILYRNRRILVNTFIALKTFYVQNPFFAVSLTFICICLFLKGFLVPPTTIDSMTYHLARVLMMQNDGHYFLKNFADYRQDIMPIGYDILNFLYLRFYTDYGLAVFGFLSYTIVLAGIFAVVTKLFSDRKLSKMVCLVSASLTMFVLNATSTKNDLILASVTIVCVLSAYNYFKNRNGIHLFILCVTLIFGASAKFTFGAFLLPFIFFYAIFMFTEFGFKSAILPINNWNLKYFPFFMLPLSMISLILTLLIHNYTKYGFIMGPDFYSAVHTENAGFTGIALNLIRYFFDVIDLPVEAGGKVINTVYDFIVGKYRFIGLFPGVTSVPLTRPLFTKDVLAWYGLLGLPICVSILFTIFWGKGFLRGVAISLFIFASVIISQLSWAPWNGRFFALAFAGGMICFAFMFKWIERKSLRLSKAIIVLALFVSILNFFYLTFYVNLIHFDKLKHQFKDHNYIYSKFYSNECWDFFVDKIKPGLKVLLVTGTNTPVFPLLLRRPDLAITITGAPDTYSSGLIYTANLYREPFKANGKEYNLLKYSDFKTVQNYYDIILPLNVPKKFLDYYKNSLYLFLNGL